jgi:hypothetical protein
MALALAVFFILPATAMYFVVHSGPNPAQTEVKGPQAQLVVELLRADGTRLGSGSYTLRGRPRQSLPIGFLTAPQSYTGQFDAGRLSLDALPPMRAELQLLLATGERADLVIELQAGENRQTLRF